MTAIVRAAAVQLNSTEDPDRNQELADRLVREAAGRGAELVVLPEKWNVMGRGEVMAAGAQALDGRTITWAQGLAVELGIDFVPGSIVESISGRERRANTAVHIAPDGRVQAVYRKLHMFDVEVDGVSYAESEHALPGEEISVSELRGCACLGMTICYDLRFPELYRELSGRGAEILTVSAAFTLATTRDHWEVLLRARAIENQCFVIASNEIGTHPGGNRSGGRSTIIDPWGIVLATAPDSDCVIVADLDMSLLHDVRRRLPALEHRRHDVFSGAALATGAGAAGA
jgi:predicted amidohydrolase